MWCVRYVWSLLLFSYALGQGIPENRLTDWSDAGTLFSSKDYVEVNVVEELELDSTGTIDNSSFLNNTIKFTDTPTIYFFPPGEYLFNNQINISVNDVVLKGAGSDSTRFIFQFTENQNCLRISTNNVDAISTSIVDGYTKNSRFLTVDNASKMLLGWAEIYQENGEWNTNQSSANWEEHSIGQMVNIVSIEGNVIEIDPPLNYSYSPELSPVIRNVQMVERSGFECFSVHRPNVSENLTSRANFDFSFAADCWLIGVESSYADGWHVSVRQSSNIDIRGNYFHHAHSYGNEGGGRGYGVALHKHSVACLIEDNIFETLRHAMMVKQGANGNVFAYNYSTDNTATTPPYQYDYIGDISLHGHYPFANLFEGNIVQFISADSYWGPSGMNNVFFRNRMEKYGFAIEEEYLSAHYTDSQIVVANEIVDSGLFAGILPYGYKLTGSGHFEDGNIVAQTYKPHAPLHAHPKSLLYSSKPGFWDIEDAWGEMGEIESAYQLSIPSKQRFEAGGILTVCAKKMATDSVVVPPDTSITSILQEEIDFLQVVISPNPAENTFVVESAQPFEVISIYSLDGEEVYNHRFQNHHRQIIQSGSWSSGVYIIHIQFAERVETLKLVKN